MSLRQGPDRDAVNYDAAVAAGFNLPADRRKPVPAALAQAPLDDVKPTGAFIGRTAAETRAHALSRKEKMGVSLYARQINGHWCVVRTVNNVTEYVEG